MKKRGQWVEVLRQTNKIKSNLCPKEGKENISLYGNVKSKSIKNVFWESAVKKESKEKKIEQKESLKSVRI